MTNFVIYSYSSKSQSAKLLAKELNTYCLPGTYSIPTNKPPIIINWGCSNPKIYVDYNAVFAIWNACNKWASFASFRDFGVSCPNFTDDPHTVVDWLKQDLVVIGRKSLTGTRGKGIVIIKDIPEFVECPLYTLYEKPTKEFRIHVVNGKMIDAEEKRRRKSALDADQVNQYVRNLKGGWVFCHQNVEVPKSVEQESIKAVKALGLDFGGVDCIWQKKGDRALILEVNTAPGLSPTTVSKYAAAFKEMAA